MEDYAISVNFLRSHNFLPVFGPFQMFHMLNNHVIELRSKRRREQRINALLAQLSVASDTLLGRFRSVPINILSIIVVQI